MKTRILFLLFTAFSFAASAQSVSLPGKQIEPATAPGQVLISGADLRAGWVPSPFPKWTDTTTHIATKFNVAAVDGKTITGGNFSNGDIVFSRLNGSTMTVSIGSGFYIPQSQKATPNGVATLGADGRVPAAQLPAQQVSATFVVADQAAMLALSTAKQGDFAKRTDQSKMYVLRTAPASTLANWEEWFDNTGISTVNGLSGPNVNMTTDNISEGATNKYFTLTAARQAYTGVGAINVNSGNGQISLNNSTVVAGSNYNSFGVNAQGLITSASTIPYLQAADLVPYYTKANLQTPGQSIVDFGNLVNVPSNIAWTPEWQESTGSTSSTITLAYPPKFIIEVQKNGQGIHKADFALASTTLTLGFTRTNSDVIKIIYGR